MLKPIANAKRHGRRAGFIRLVAAAGLVLAMAPQSASAKNLPGFSILYEARSHGEAGGGLVELIEGGGEIRQLFDCRSWLFSRHLLFIFGGGAERVEIREDIEYQEAHDGAAGQIHRFLDPDKRRVKGPAPAPLG